MCKELLPKVSTPLNMSKVYACHMRNYACANLTVEFLQKPNTYYAL